MLGIFNYEQLDFFIPMNNPKIHKLEYFNERFNTCTMFLSKFPIMKIKRSYSQNGKFKYTLFHIATYIKFYIPHTYS